MFWHGSYGFKVSVLGSYFCNTSHVAWRFSLRAVVTRMCPSLSFFIVKPILPILISWTNPRECLLHSQSSLDVLPNTSRGTFFLCVLRSGKKRLLESWAINLCCTGARKPLVRAHTPRCIPFFKAAVLLHASNVAVPVRISGSSLQHARESVFRGPLSSRCSSHNTTIQKHAASTKTKWAAGSFVT